MSLHGIRTDGAWQKAFASAISGSPTHVESFDYGRYGLVRFLTRSVNNRMIDRFYDWYHQTVKACKEVDLERYDARPSAVAHSFGTWILGYAMLKFPDMRFDKLVLAGSILPRDFDWGTLLARDQVSLVRNECGQKDPWPKWAGRLVARSGTGGEQGFEWFGSTVENISFEWFGHSDALMRAHIEHEWLPFLTQPACPLGIAHGRSIHDGDRFGAWLDHCRTVIDQEVYSTLPHYAEAQLPGHLSRTWININPDIYTFLIDRETSTPAGYINAMPVEDAVYAGIRSGEITDNRIPASEILPYVGARTEFKLYMMSIAISKQYRRYGEGIFQQPYMRMFSGLIEKLKYYANQHAVRVTHVLASAWRPEGSRICESFGMTELRKDRYGHTIFELDLDALRGKPKRKLMPSLRRLLAVYNQMT
jgi:pimeloyl-ACP methyl ester carboxylesterase